MANLLSKIPENINKEDIEKLTRQVNEQETIMSQLPTPTPHTTSETQPFWDAGAEGYRCRTFRPGGPTVCLGDDAPVGRRDDGGACFRAAESDSDGGAGTVVCDHVRSLCLQPQAGGPRRGVPRRRAPRD